MRKILLMAKRDYVESVKSKAFILGLIVAPLLFGGGFLGIAIIKKRPDLKDRHVAILDRTGAAAALIVRAATEKNEKELYEKGTRKQVLPRYAFEVVEPAAGDPRDQRLTLSDRVRSRELVAFLEIWPAALEAEPAGEPERGKALPRIAIYSNSTGVDNARNWLRDPISRGIRQVHLGKLGVPAERQGVLLQAVPVDPMSLLARDPKSGAVQAAKKSDGSEIAAPLGLVMLLTMIVMIGTAPMLSAVTEDKNHRIFEMLLGLATPFELMAARVLAALGRALTSSAFYIAGAILVLQGMSMLGVVPFGLLPWFFIYLIAHVTMLCSFAAALGAACSSPQDAQNLAVVLITPIMIPYFLLVPVMESPNGALATAISLIPPFTPPMMLLRQALPAGVAWWQPWLGLALVVAWTITGTWAAARIFRIAILMQGQAPKLREMVRWAVRG